jgi:cytoskeletal protein CcmA (bactofilin family)
MSDPKNRKTLVEEGTQFKGSLSSDCPIEVKGRVEGDLSAPALSVSPSGAVHGKIKVGEIRSQGELAGEFDADVVQLSGTVRDNTVIRAKSLEVKLAPPGGKMQVIFGECELEVGSEQVEKTTGTQAPERARSQSGRPAAEASGAQPDEATTAEANGAT